MNDKNQPRYAIVMRTKVEIDWEKVKSICNEAPGSFARRMGKLPGLGCVLKRAKRRAGDYNELMRQRVGKRLAPFGIAPDQKIKMMNPKVISETYSDRDMAAMVFDRMRDRWEYGYYIEVFLARTDDIDFSTRSAKIGVLRNEYAVEPVGQSGQPLDKTMG